jgi:hypothetical protein
MKGWLAQAFIDTRCKARGATLSLHSQGKTKDLSMGFLQLSIPQLTAF